MKTRIYHQGGSELVVLWIWNIMKVLIIHREIMNLLDDNRLQDMIWILLKLTFYG